MALNRRSDSDRLGACSDHDSQSCLPGVDDHWPLPGMDNYPDCFVNYVLPRHPDDRVAHATLR